VADTVLLSHNKKHHPGQLPANLVQIPLLEECCGNNEFRLSDGTTVRNVDAVVYCTGYEYEFPFLRDCGLDWSDGAVVPLYKHIVNINFPSMGFIGLVSKTCPLPSFDLQARFLVNHITGTVNLQKITMSAELDTEVEAHQSAGRPMRHFHVMMDSQWQYFRELAEIGAVDMLPNFYQDMFIEVFDRRYNFLTVYRKDVYHLDANNGTFTSKYHSDSE